MFSWRDSGKARRWGLLRAGLVKAGQRMIIIIVLQGLGDLADFLGTDPGGQIAADLAEVEGGSAVGVLDEQDQFGDGLVEDCVWAAPAYQKYSSEY